MTLQQIYLGALPLINEFLRREAQQQGHYLTGKLNDSFSGRMINKTDFEGFAEHYIKFLENGVPATSASMKQFPFVKRFWILRGLPDKEAGSAAAATIRIWMKQGMSTQASKRFSSTGAREHLVENAFVVGDVKLNGYFANMFDFAVDEAYRQVKSETL